jgi:hypothetical protein
MEDTGGIISSSQLTEFVINSINLLFQTEIPNDLDPLTLGNNTFRTFISLFSSNYKDTERSVISTTIIPKDQ